MKNITSAETVCGELLGIGTEVESVINGETIRGVIESMKMSEYHSCLNVYLKGGERLYLEPQWSPSTGTQVRLSGIGFTVRVLKKQPVQMAIDAI